MVIFKPTSIQEAKAKKVTLEELKAENELLKGYIMELTAEVYKQAPISALPIGLRSAIEAEIIKTEVIKQ